ncbi:PrpF domain-containing protein [Bacillus sp. DTU_2020_1000418_1_SI_GHA_SEK_038]|uniref:2-methylaconitate cis-trans isomerase PrpF family protein n=1 Tax=Bacillus sp. DTU_2020_1000418_1_SI_GHA_SEK_038 TaxID=3077585 RepID=UPI0028E31940|nr:PrpF domain-containing protein [Bacillus sp. DTU_2020_1000418_1_SI_GHA_SEK_038]WNS75360.1 PrpF domain-containing protein [Bacillus sp. DTU_2020_1000418_1_SI_GHA_SEK_038]
MNIHGKLYKLPSVLMRGGTSKGLILKDVDLPKDPEERDLVITKIYGSSKNGQIDGVGGGTPLTSKVAIVGVTDKLGCDIYYTFGQVSTNSQNIDYNVTCGNMASAVGLFAVEEGLVKITEGHTTVKIYNTNTMRVMEVEIPVFNGQIVYDGDFSISGVSGTGSCIMVNFLDFGGAFTGKLFPTGNIVDLIDLGDNKEIEVTIIDVGNILVFIKASDLGLMGTELSGEINNKVNRRNIENIRVKCGKLIGLFHEGETITPETHALPKIVIVSQAQDFTDENGELVKKEKIDIVGRYIAMGTLHRAFAVSGAIGLGTACNIPGTIPNSLISTNHTNQITIGHPTGTILVNVNIEKNNSSFKLVKGGIGRTARRIMEGNSYVPIELMGK